MNFLSIVVLSESNEAVLSQQKGQNGERTSYIMDNC